MKNIQLGLYLIFFFLYISCSPKVQEAVIVKDDDIKAPKQEVIDNPCTTFDELSGSKSQEVLDAFVLYRDALKANNFAEARRLWIFAVYNAPAANGRVKYQFDDGIKIYTHYYNNTSNQAVKNSIMDTINYIYDKRVECFGEADYALGRKAFDYYYTFQGYKSDDEIFAMFRQSADSKGAKMDYFIINPFTKLLYDQLVEKKISHEDGSKYALDILEAVENGLANCGNKCEAWEIIADYAPKRLEALEGYANFYPCTYYEEKYFPEFELAPNDCEIIAKVFRKLNWGKCESTSMALMAVKSAKQNNCYTPPPPPGPLRKGFDCYNNGDFQCAVDNFEIYINEKTNDPEKKAKYSLIIAKIYYGDLKKFSTSRKYARQAAKYKPNWGDPYILIGKLYASSGPICGPGRGWDSQIVTWPAIDKFKYAKKIDPSSAAEANKIIATYTKYMPSVGEIFQRGLKEGAPFKVNCWIQETTTIRGIKN